MRAIPTLLPSLLPVLLVRTPGPAMDVTVCTGGACCESGAERLLDAVTVLGASDAELTVKTAFCSGECPPDGAVRARPASLTPA
jgi:hypothetical protein